jgi:hypothetical protein
MSHLMNITTGAAGPVCVVLGKLLIGAVAVALSLAYLALCLGRALQALADDEAAR